MKPITPAQQARIAALVTQVEKTAQPGSAYFSYDEDTTDPQWFFGWTTPDGNYCSTENVRAKTLDEALDAAEESLSVVEDEPLSDPC